MVSSIEKSREIRKKYDNGDDDDDNDDEFFCGMVDRRKGV